MFATGRLVALSKHSNKIILVGAKKFRLPQISQEGLHSFRALSSYRGYNGSNERIQLQNNNNIIKWNNEIGILSRKNDRNGFQAIAYSKAFSTNENKDEKNANEENESNKEEGETKTTSDLRDTIHRLKSEHDNQETKNNNPNSDSNANSNSSPLDTAQGFLSSFMSEVGKTWEELLDSGSAKGINKRIGEAKNDAAPVEVYKGPTDLMMIDESEHMGAWEKMQKRLSEAPIIQGMLEKSEDLYAQSGAKEAKQRLDEVKEDAKEAWETSQNPWVYRASSVYDTLTAETDMAIATRELQKLDPQFTMEQFKQDAVEQTIPEIMQVFLDGRITELKEWLGESVYKRLAAENKVRKDEGLVVDSNLLGIFNADIVAVEMDKVEKEPIILIHFMAQQINCVRNKDGEVVEGREDDIKANSYLMAFQRVYIEEAGTLNWKIVDFRFNGAIAWI